MSRRWTRVVSGTHHCGLCGRLIVVDEAMLLISIPNLRDLKRCATCLPAPTETVDLPPHKGPTEARVAAPMTSARTLAANAQQDFKHRQAGGDE